jgi:predicted phosphohydrolase
MVNFQIMSDLHIENYPDDVSIDNFITPSADYLILAGDIGRINKYTQIKSFLTQLSKKFKYIIYILGNHEYYSVSENLCKNMDDILSDIYSLAKELQNVYILNRDSVIVEDVLITGCTLWSDCVFVPRFIVKIPKINTHIYNEMYKKDLAYIEQSISFCQENKYKLLVVSHHCPSFNIGHNLRSKFGDLYCTDLEHLLHGNKIHTWVCGHIHKNFDFITKNGTRLVSNQKGKPKDKITNFSLYKIINV